MELKECYTKVDNVFFEYAMSLKPNEIKVLLYIIRNTVGYHKDEFETNYSKISEACLMARRHAKISIEGLIKIGLITKYESYKYDFFIVYDTKNVKNIMLDFCV